RAEILAELWRHRDEFHVEHVRRGKCHRERSGRHRRHRTEWPGRSHHEYAITRRAHNESSRAECFSGDLYAVGLTVAHVVHLHLVANLHCAHVFNKRCRGRLVLDAKVLAIDADDNVTGPQTSVARGPTRRHALHPRAFFRLLIVAQVDSEHGPGRHAGYARDHVVLHDWTG